MQEVGDHKPVLDQLGARPSGHLDVADYDSVRLLGHFSVSSLPEHETHAVVIVGSDGHESLNVSRRYSCSASWTDDHQAWLVELKPAGWELLVELRASGLPPSSPARLTQRGAPLETVIEAFLELLMDRRPVPSGLGDRIGKKLPGVVKDGKGIRALFSAPPD